MPDLVETFPFAWPWYMLALAGGYLLGSVPFGLILTRAAGLGDIGQHFPDTDEALRDADSMDLLREVVARVGAAGFSVEHVDATVMLERPKLAPHRDAIHASLAAVLGSVNVKATTGEGMGFVGRGEGAAARDAFGALSSDERTKVVEFVESL